MENRKSPTKITPELIQKLTELIQDGKSNKEIADLLNIGTTTITTYKKKYNIQYNKSTALDRKDEIIHLYTTGTSVKDIAKILGYKSQTTIKVILNKENIVSNRDVAHNKIKNKIKEICPNCISIYEASKKVGCSPTTIRKYMKQFNISLKVKYELSEQDVANIPLDSLKFEFDSNIKDIPIEYRREFIITKIKTIILNKRKYTGILLLKQYNINPNYLHSYNISIEALNTELGLKRINGSSLELYFSEYCELNNIIYESQKTFPNCRISNNLRFDYYLPEYNILLEIQGKQHFEPVSKFGGDETFKDGQIRDTIKQEWCNRNNIKLICISYRDLYKNNYLDNLFEKEIFPVAKYKLGELLENSEVNNQQPSQS